MPSQEMLKKLLDEFVEKEALIQEEIRVVYDQIAQMESRLDECRGRLSTIGVDREKVLSIRARYLEDDFPSTVIPPSSSGSKPKAATTAPAAAPAAPSTRAASTPAPTAARTPTPAPTPAPAAAPAPSPSPAASSSKPGSSSATPPPSPASNLSLAAAAHTSPAASAPKAEAASAEPDKPKSGLFNRTQIPSVASSLSRSTPSSQPAKPATPAPAQAAAPAPAPAPAEPAPPAPAQAPATPPPMPTQSSTPAIKSPPAADNAGQPKSAVSSLLGARAFAAARGNTPPPPAPPSFGAPEPAPVVEHAQPAPPPQSDHQDPLAPFASIESLQSAWAPSTQLPVPGQDVQQPQSTPQYTIEELGPSIIDLGSSSDQNDDSESDTVKSINDALRSLFR